MGGKISFGIFIYAKIESKNIKAKNIWFKSGLSMANSIKRRIIFFLGEGF